jgi:hypothetical protein
MTILLPFSVANVFIGYQTYNATTTVVQSVRAAVPKELSNHHSDADADHHIRIEAMGQTPTRTDAVRTGCGRGTSTEYRPKVASS